MAFKCPGSFNIRQPQPEEITCPYCKKKAEIWSDEAKTVCPGCKRKVFREEGLMSCLDWCAYAKECVGEKTYARYLKNKKETEKLSYKSTTAKNGKGL